MRRTLICLALSLLGTSAEAKWRWNPAHFDKVVLTISIGNGAAAFYDVHHTQGCYPRNCYETNPLAKPFVGHASLSYGLAAGEVYGLAALAQHMKHNRLHRIWWVPQAAGIGLHMIAIKESLE